MLTRHLLFVFNLMTIVGGGEERVPSNSTKIASIKRSYVYITELQIGKILSIYLLLNRVRTSYNVALDFSSIVMVCMRSRVRVTNISSGIKKKKFQYYLCIKIPNQPLRNSFGGEWHDIFEFTYFFPLRIDRKKLFFFFNQNIFLPELIFLAYTWSYWKGGENGLQFRRPVGFEWIPLLMFWEMRFSDELTDRKIS